MDEYSLLRVGDRVLSNHGVARIKTITLAESYMLDGIDVPAVHWANLKTRFISVVLDNGHWAYGYQVYGPAPEDPVTKASIEEPEYEEAT
jgi:hypothetical protein